MPEEIKFTATPEKGLVSGLWDRPDEAIAAVVLGHGSGTNMRHPLISLISDALVGRDIAVFRFQYPYSEKGGGGLDGRKVLLATIRAAISCAEEMAEGLPLFAGGHSMSGRMTTLAEVESPLPIRGIICFAFPVNGGKGPGERAAHFKDINKPILFHQGTRDKLADLDVMKKVVDSKADSATLHVVETADHGFNVLKRAGKSQDEVIDEMANSTKSWILDVLKI